MDYNFDEMINRRGTDSYKWDSAADAGVLPLWVADMDFRTAPAVTEALATRVRQGIFGYTLVPGSYYEALDNWFTRRHGWSIDRESVIYTSGVVPAISAIIKAFTKPGDKVVVQTPVYNCFFSSIRNNGCEIVESPLEKSGDTYRMSMEDLEKCVSDSDVKIFLLCNPHNPVGRVWSHSELEEVAEICRRHDVIVVADEIHCELVMPGYEYVPFMPIARQAGCRCVSCVSPSKAFNLAGLQIANIVSPDSEMRIRIDRAINDNEVCDVNPFGVIALQAAYNKGEEWLEALKQYLYGNYVFMKDYLESRLPSVSLCRLEGTYLVWMDCRSIGISSERLEEKLLADAGLWLNAGTHYGKDGEGFMRWNIACPRQRLREALDRFISFVSGRQA